MKSPNAARRAGITLRQLDYWINKGWIAAEHASPGTGKHRDLQEEHVRTLVAMAKLVHLGMKPEAAAPLAQRLTTSASQVVVGGVRISLTAVGGSRIACPVCGRDVTTRKDGLLRAHRSAPGTRALCSGSRTTASEVPA